MEGKGSKRDSTPEDDIDALFALPLIQFTGSRNALAARLKQSGRGDEAAHVKALVKPSVSAWAVNQLYWKHRKAFDRLIAAGQRFRQAQVLRLGGKLADTQGPRDEQREALSELSKLAAALLGDAGHNATSETMHRIATTLEGMSFYASLPGAPAPGRLSSDVDPPGFEALAALVPDAGITERTEGPARSSSSAFHESAPAITNSPKGARVNSTGSRDLEQTGRARVAAARRSLQDAERLLNKVRLRAQSAEAASRKAGAEAREAEKQMRQAAERFEKARAASEEADRRARTLAADAEEETKAAAAAERAVQKASSELQSLLPKLQGTRIKGI